MQIDIEQSRDEQQHREQQQSKYKDLKKSAAKFSNKSRFLPTPLHPSRVWLGTVSIWLSGRMIRTGLLCMCNYHIFFTFYFFYFILLLTFIFLTETTDANTASSRRFRHVTPTPPQVGIGDFLSTLIYWFTTLMTSLIHVRLLIQFIPFHPLWHCTALV